MGNAQTTSQKIEQILENYQESHSIARSDAECKIDITVDTDGSTFKNCSLNTKQDCTSFAEIDTASLTEALVSGSSQSDVEQVTKGLALSFSSSASNNEIRSSLINEIRQSCDAQGDLMIENNTTYNLKNSTFDCTDLPDKSLVRVIQLGDATASCMVKQIIESQQQHSTQADSKQENEGLQLPGFFAIIGIIVVVLALLALAAVYYYKLKKKGKTVSTQNTQPKLNTTKLLQQAVAVVGTPVATSSKPPEAPPPFQRLLAGAKKILENVPVPVKKVSPPFGTGSVPA